eukprot:TRINITY_DN30944_c0_g3_i1.p3 TRINITY_DN30944_c0_g3~~TRINITY_DN30944_c0_g3_i1.p3  ORF type:complete len:104 (+),score=1.65 TRINITY_DN30944_c0_g3_i1:661-972(+)
MYSCIQSSVKQLYYLFSHRRRRQKNQQKQQRRGLNKKNMMVAQKKFDTSIKIFCGKITPTLKNHIKLQNTHLSMSISHEFLNTHKYASILQIREYLPITVIVP